MITIDTTNMCSHLQKKLYEENGIYHSLWIAMQDDPELTAVVRSRQLHIYRNGIKVLVLAGKSAPKIIREDAICELLHIERIKWMEQRYNNALAASSYQKAHSSKFFSTPSPFQNAAPTFFWLSTWPWKAASRYHRKAL